MARIVTYICDVCLHENTNIQEYDGCVYTLNRSIAIGLVNANHLHDRPNHVCRECFDQFICLAAEKILNESENKKKDIVE